MWDDKYFKWNTDFSFNAFNFQVLIMELSEIDICFLCLLILNSSINKIMETFYFWEKYAESDFCPVNNS